MLNIATRAAEHKARSQGVDVVDVELPANLDPVRHRIVATHFFGWHPVGEVAARLVLRLLSAHDGPFNG